MTYSIFENTMADMTYQEIEEAAKNDSIVLFPISVIEEHGPHLPLATDTYVAYKQALEIKKNLEKENIKTIIAPPFYWGINFITGSFTGSFTLQKSTMVQVLVDLLCNLQKWGFNKIFTTYCHGDIHHNTAILQAFQKARIDYGVEAYHVLSDNEITRFNAEEYIDYIVKIKTENQSPQKPPKYMDVHAGKFETSYLIAEFPDTVKIELAKKLESSKTTFEDFMIWRKGWDFNKKIAPLGYCGNPSDLVTPEEIKKFFVEEYKKISDAIIEFLDK